MLDFLLANVTTIIICALLILMVAAIIKKLIKDHRLGKSSCGCSCDGCQMNGSCHNKDNKKPPA